MAYTGMLLLPAAITDNTHDYKAFSETPKFNTDASFQLICDNTSNKIWL